MQVELNAPEPSTKPPKEMLSFRPASETDSGVNEWRINYSSLDLITTCPRKAFYALERGLVSNEEKPALLFGTAIHKALETWYTFDRKSRDNEVALAAFYESGKALETLVEAVDKRSLANGEKILRHYFKEYDNDPYTILRDGDGMPYIERRFEFLLAESPGSRVYFFGTIDAILHDSTTNTTVVCDHKTTSALGQEFLQRVKPNHQYTGYVMGARRVFGIDTNLFLINGLQVAKTVHALGRQVTTRDEADYRDFTNSVMWAISCYKSFVESGVWPQTAPNPCTQWGGCPYREICAAPESIRETMILGLYKERT